MAEGHIDEIGILMLYNAVFGPWRWLMFNKVVSTTTHTLPCVCDTARQWLLQFLEGSSRDDSRFGFRVAFDQTGFNT